MPRDDYEVVIAYTLTNELLGKLANGIFDDNDNRIVNDVSREIKTVDELNNSNIKKKNNFELK